MFHTVSNAPLLTMYSPCFISWPTLDAGAKILWSVPSYSLPRRDCRSVTRGWRAEHQQPEPQLQFTDLNPLLTPLTDSGDWALSKAGKQKGEYGKEIPTPDAIPHASPSPLVGSVGSSAGNGFGTPSGALSPGSLRMMSPSSSSMGGGNGGLGATNSSPPGSFVIGNTGGTSPTGSSGLGQNNSNAPMASPPGNGTAPGAVPITGSSPASAVSLSMSPGRVGIGGSMGGPISAAFIHGLATSPTRSFGSFPIAHSHNSSIHHHSYSSTSTSPTGSGSGPSLGSSVGVGIPIGNHTSLSPPSGTSAGGLTGSSPHISATTGNQVGKTQFRRTSQSDGSATTPAIASVLPAVNAASNMGYAEGTASPPARSALANSITPDSLMEGEDAEEEGLPVNLGAGEDEQIEGMELQ